MCLSSHIEFKNLAVGIINAEIASDPQTFDGAEEIFMLHDF